CGAPASHCQLHHIVYRRRDGATIVGNLVLVCWACHHDIHHNHWTVVRTNNRYTIRRPDTTPLGLDRERKDTG
ncbi:MAG: HNH endonuclease signature motif containing protein, partial [Egibacteraceae bacterium]